ncbi:hypothetical protein [Pseudonocardia kunmingensis]|uniref:MFS transporter n=1 Tax=Pseudonocardia kunmingensis TaxID=630975 RepID=A0A543DQ29_9PSEU|nr:hypothetical protein [Pseudonocardia kunmingensis]TQM11452.1 hypothetical protein FB558_4015 [Pseudonocardia kunmingensis]
MLAGAGLLVAAVGFAPVSTSDVDSPPGVVMACYAVVTLGTGIIAPLAVARIVSTAPAHRTGSAATATTS